MTKKKITIVGIISAVFILGVGVGIGLYLNQDTNTETRYPLLSRRVQSDNPQELSLRFSELRQELQTVISKMNTSGETVDLYFEYLPTGVSINIGESQDVIGASLMKVPRVMNLYKLAETEQFDLDSKLTLKQEWLNNQYGTLYKKGAGYEVSYRELARLALKDSDNTAILAISEAVDSLPATEDTMNSLDVAFDTQTNGAVVITPYSYTSIMKCLYFACHLNNEHSQELLNYLTESSFGDRLTKYLPTEVEVAHKIGTYSNDSQSDCGIVYLENRNYALCIMVKGEDPAASESIANLSNRVYKFLISDLRTD